MAAKIIQNLQPTNYASPIKSGAAHGNISVSADFQLLQINCTIDGLGSFEASGGARGSLGQPTIHPEGFDKAEQLGAQAAAIVNGIQAELDALKAAQQ